MFISLGFIRVRIWLRRCSIFLLYRGNGPSMMGWRFLHMDIPIQKKMLTRWQTRLLTNIALIGRRVVWYLYFAPNLKTIFQLDLNAFFWYDCIVALGKETNIINLNYLVPPSYSKYKGQDRLSMREDWDPNNCSLLLGYNRSMTTGITCSICGNDNATQVTTAANYCVSCYGRYYENRKR